VRGWRGGFSVVFCFFPSSTPDALRSFTSSNSDGLLRPRQMGIGVRERERLESGTRCSAHAGFVGLMTLLACTELVRRNRQRTQKRRPQRTWKQSDWSSGPGTW
jgi:hypothetical protein